jgi:hypothetical protein
MTSQSGFHGRNSANRAAAIASRTGFIAAECLKSKEETESLMGSQAAMRSAGLHHFPEGSSTRAGSIANRSMTEGGREAGVGPKKSPPGEGGAGCRMSGLASLPSIEDCPDTRGDEGNQDKQQGVAGGLDQPAQERDKPGGETFHFSVPFEASAASTAAGPFNLYVRQE